MAQLRTDTRDAAAAARLEAVRRYDIADARLQPLFQNVVDVAARTLGMSAAMITLIDATRLWTVATSGIGPLSLPREETFCGRTIERDVADVMVVPDLTADARFAASRFVTATEGLRFYAGVPLSIGEGRPLGTLCVVDTAPRETFDDASRELLASLSAIAVDLLELRAERQTLVRAQARMEEFTQAAVDLFWETDAEHRYTYISGSEPHERRAAEGYDRSAVVRAMLGRTRWEAAGADPSREPWRSHLATLKAGRPFRDFRYAKALPDSAKTLPEDPTLTASDGFIHVSTSGRPFFDADGTLLGYRGAAHDVTAEEASKAREIELANTDPLTDLPNRRRWQERLDGAVARAGAAKSDLAKSNLAKGDPADGAIGSALILVDLDHFKETNDTLGHAVGDDLLKEIARRLRASLREGDFAARLGGDEFAVLLRGIRTSAQAGRAAERLLGDLRRPVAIGKHVVHPGASLGIALLPQDGVTADAIMVSADLALYRAKNEGRGRHAFFQEELRATVERRGDVARQLHRAIEAGEFEMHYQPQITVASGAITGVEALLRWRHPDRGLLAPAAFLDVLETSGFNLEVGGWTIDEACRQAALWQGAGTPVRIGVNISPGQMQAGDLPEIVSRALARHDVPARLLEIEITERVILRRDSGSLAALQRLRGLGVSVAFDDFGTGFASLATLRDCPLDRVKIDRAFIADVLKGGREASIAKSLLAMCRGLGLPVTAEGVEDAGQDVFLQLQGCEEAQGYHYGRPMPAAEMSLLLAKARLEDGAARVRDSGGAADGAHVFVLEWPADAA